MRRKNILLELFFSPLSPLLPRNSLTALAEKSFLGKVEGAFVQER
jgi:hypothetical protein